MMPPLTASFTNYSDNTRTGRNSKEIIPASASVNSASSGMSSSLDPSAFCRWPPPYFALKST
jgi:hypothetical protein